MHHPERRNLSAAEVEQLGATLGIGEQEVWEWIKEKLKGPGAKLPRPGRGLPSFDVPKWAIVVLVAYLMWKSE